VSKGWMVRFATAAAVVALVVIAGCTSDSGDSGASTSGGGGEPIKVGAILSLTGNYAGLGGPEKNALELQVKEINDAGGINGRPIDLIIEDDGTDEAKAVSAASKLIEQDQVVAILGATGTGQSMAIRGDVDRAGIPEISMAGGTAITGTFDKLVYQTPWSNTLVVPFVLQHIKDLGHTKVALLSSADGYGKDGKAIILAEAPKAGVSIVSDQTFNPGDTDFSAQLTKMKSSGADAMLMWTAGKDAANIMKTSKDLGISQPWFGGSGQARTEFPAGAGDAAEGFQFGTGKSLLPETWGTDSEQYKVVSDFASRYKAAYGTDPDIFAGHAFDAINILAAALKSTKGDTDPAKLNSAVEATKGLVGFGGTFNYSPTDHNGLTRDDLTMYVIKGGTWQAAQ
jgi:branched-chain amino acid transport system substrate-binding protein